jgi:hypothetical protein
VVKKFCSRARVVIKIPGKISRKTLSETRGVEGGGENELRFTTHWRYFGRAGSWTALPSSVVCVSAHFYRGGYDCRVPVNPSLRNVSLRFYSAVPEYELQVPSLRNVSLNSTGFKLNPVALKIQSLRGWVP